MLMGQKAVDELVNLLNLETIEVNIFRGRSPAVSLQRVFGGQVAGQALIAAGRTTPEERIVHSLHGYFIRPGDPDIPIVYTVDRVRDGRSFSVRRVVAVQHGEPIFFMSASFHLREEGLDHHDLMPADITAPEELPRLADQLAEAGTDLLGSFAEIARPIDVRYVGTPGWIGTRTPSEQLYIWMKADGQLPEDPLIHVCVLAFASDITLLDAVLARHGAVWGPSGFIGASLDHAMWFHRPFRADEWNLYVCRSPSASGARGLATGSFFSRDGVQLATAVQEGLLRKSSP